MTEVHVVSHTHWDREWYLPFEVFRARLVELVDRVIEISKRYPQYRFHLDGQTVILEDYAEVGEKIERLVKLVEDGRIQVGPWYVLPDEFLITGESWIRNYLYSEKVAERFGVRLSKVAYLPDMFGHNAYMPTVLKGLGMDWAVLWRGVGDDRLTTFVWKSPHGDTVNTYHLVHGYGNGSHRGRKGEKFKAKLLREVESLRAISGGDPVLLMNGTDHELPLPNIVEILGDLSNDDIRFVQSDLEMFLKKLDEPKVERVGELRNPKKEHVLKDVASTRISGKRLHFEALQLYEHYVEPLMALARLNGEELPQEELWYGWRLILQSQPHDSVCGCGTDEVHEAVLNRLKRAIDHGKALCARSAKVLLREERSEKGVLVFNPLEWEEEVEVDTVVYLPKGTWRVEGTESSVVAPLDDVDTRGEWKDSLALRFISEDSVDAVVPRDAIPHRCRFKAKLPALGLKGFRIASDERRDNSGTFETPFEIAENGTLEVDWRGHSYENLCYLKDVEDAGDEYNYSPASGEVYTSLSVEADVEHLLSTSWIERDRVTFSLELPKSLTPDRSRRSPETVEMPVVIEYEFHSDEPRVDVVVELENKAKDHRLTVVFPLGKIEKLYTDGYFGLVEHEVRDYSGDYGDWAELPENAFTMWSLVTMPERGVTLVTRGLHEVHVTEDGLELTLLRGVEWLSRGDLKTRKGHAGPFLWTPGAQELGRHRFEFSLLLHDGWGVEEIYKRARRVLLKPMAWQGDYEVEQIELPFEIRKGFLSAFKPAEDGRGVVVRIFDPAGGTPDVVVPAHAEEINLAERKSHEEERSASPRTWRIVQGSHYRV